MKGRGQHQRGTGNLHFDADAGPRDADPSGPSLAVTDPVESANRSQGRPCREGERDETDGHDRVRDGHHDRRNQEGRHDRPYDGSVKALLCTRDPSRVLIQCPSHHT